MNPLITVTQRDRVVIATLGNPPHGFMTTGMVEELDTLVRRYENDAGVGVVILTGAHPQRFLAHFDVAEILAIAALAPRISYPWAALGLRMVDLLRRLPGMTRLLTTVRTPLTGVLLGRKFHDTMRRMGRSKVVYIAAINGHALGGGCELAMSCDFRLMVDAPVGIGQPEVLLGFPPGAGGTQRMARLIGPAQALEYCLLGTPLTPQDALRLGLIHRLVPPDQLMLEAMTLARRLSQRSKCAVGGIKRAVLEGSSLSLQGGLKLEQAMFLAATTTPQAKQAMATYLARLKECGQPPIYEAGGQSALVDGTFSNMTQE